MQKIAAREAARLEVTTNAGNAKIGYSFAIAPASTNIGPPTVAARGKARHSRSAKAISENSAMSIFARSTANITAGEHARSEEHTSELQSLRHLVCRLLLEKKNAA